MDSKVINISGSEYCIDADGSVRNVATIYHHFVPGQPLPTDGARNADRLLILNWKELTEAQQTECGAQVQIYDEEAAKWQLL